MNWSIVGQLLATSAPLAGKLLGSVIPVPGGAIMGELLGKAIARQFGVPETPAAVSEAIAKSGNDVIIAKTNAALEEVKSRDATVRAIVEAEEARMTEQLKQVNETIRVEILPENRHPYYTGWRPACGWVLVYSFIVYGTLFFVAMALSAFYDNDRPLQVIADAWPPAALYFGSLSLVNGVNIWTRTKDKESLRTAAAAGVPVATRPTTTRKP